MYDYPLSYSEFRDEELLNLASRIHTFMPDAQRALSAELQNRGLHAPQTDSAQLPAYSSLSSRIETVRIIP